MVPLSTYLQSPNCGFPVKYTATLSSGQTLPTFITVISSSMMITAYSIQHEDEGTYPIDVTAVFPQ